MIAHRDNLGAIPRMNLNIPVPPVQEPAPAIDLVRETPAPKEPAIIMNAQVFWNLRVTTRQLCLIGRALMEQLREDEVDEADDLADAISHHRARELEAMGRTAAQIRSAMADNEP